jgi:hypothetical protein
VPVIDDDHIRMPVDHINLDAINHLARVSPFTPVSIQVARSEKANLSPG